MKIGFVISLYGTTTPLTELIIFLERSLPPIMIGNGNTGRDRKDRDA